MIEHHQHPIYVCKPSKIMSRTRSPKLRLYKQSSQLSLNLQNTRTHPLTNLMLLSEHISPCLTNMTYLNQCLLNKEPDTHPDHIQNMKMKTLLQRIRPRDPEPDPPLHRGLQKSEPLTSHFSPGSHLNPPRIYSSLPVNSSWGQWSKIMPLTSNSWNSEFSALNEYPNFLTWNGTMSLPENLSTLMLSSPECTPLQLTASRTIENLREIKLHFRADKPAKSVETHRDWVIAWGIAFWATKFIFPYWEKELKEYTKYVSSYFTSLHSSAHWKVFKLDKAIHKWGGSINDISFNEFSKFRYLETCYLHRHSTGESGAKPKQKTTEKSGAGTA